MPKNSYDLEPNISAALTYLIPFVTGILFFYLEKRNKFVRFHALQSILFWGLVWVINSASIQLSFLLIGFPFHAFVRIAAFFGWIFMIWKAYENEKYEIPYIGKVAKDIIYKK